jgi:hypothetical protein
MTHDHTIFLGAPLMLALPLRVFLVHKWLHRSSACSLTLSPRFISSDFVSYGNAGNHGAHYEPVRSQFPLAAGPCINRFHCIALSINNN